MNHLNNRGINFSRDQSSKACIQFFQASGKNGRFRWQIGLSCSHAEGNQPFRGKTALYICFSLFGKFIIGINISEIVDTVDRAFSHLVVSKRPNESLASYE